MPGGDLPLTAAGTTLLPDPVPFSFEDGSASLVQEIAPTFSLPNWHHYWAKF
jgi:hypothetical protein